MDRFVKARGVNEMGEAFKTACTHLEASRPGLSKGTRDQTACYPPKLVTFRRF
jgi:hypothetical protein